MLCLSSVCRLSSRAARGVNQNPNARVCTMTEPGVRVVVRVRRYASVSVKERYMYRQEPGGYPAVTRDDMRAPFTHPH